MLAVGANGAGKTNLLESLHVGTQGFSPRTRSDAELIRFGERGRAHPARRVAAQTRSGSASAYPRREGKRAELNGARLRAAEQLRSETATLVFTPDRLAIVKGGPAARRAYFDRALARLFPSRAALAADYARRSRSATRRSSAADRARRDRAVDGRRSRSSARRWSRRAARRSRC